METRLQILRSATHLVRRGGAEALTLRALARRLELTAPAVYRHFAGRDALLEEVVEEGYRQLGERLAAGLEQRSPLARLRGLLNGYLDFALAEKELARLMFQTPRRTLRRFPEDFAAGRSAVFTLVAREVEACMAAGELRRDDVLETTLAAWAEAHGLVSLFRLGRFGKDEAKFRALYQRSIERLLRGLEAR
jgi:AcrR family transcriptional regulator